jgi:glycosyltransferase involved in cell wall biosynthesis
LTSDSEAFGNIIVESLICDTPIVSTNPKYGGPSEILTGCLSKYLTDCGNTNVIASKIKKFFNKNIDCDFELTKFDVSRIADTYLNLANYNSELDIFDKENN